MIKNLIKEIEQEMRKFFDNEQLSLLRKVLDHIFRNISIEYKNEFETIYKQSSKS